MTKYKVKSGEEQEFDKIKIETFKKQGLTDTYFKCLININKLGLKESELLKAEREITSIRLANLEINPIEGNFDLKHLQSYHKKLFGDIYYFAGEVRDVYMAIDSVTVFATPNALPKRLQDFFGRLKSDNNLKGLEKGEFTEKLADYLTDINILHPFREGNGRSKRAFFRELSRQAGYNLDWAANAAIEWRLADEVAFDSSRDGARDATYLRMLLDKAVTPLASQNIIGQQLVEQNKGWDNLKAKKTHRGLGNMLENKTENYNE